MTEIQIKRKLLEGCSLSDHINFQTNNYCEYLSNLLLLLYEYNNNFTVIELAKILVASLIRNDKQFASCLLKDERYDLPIILKCCDILDSRRVCIQLEKKTDKIKNIKKLGKHKALIANLKTLSEGIIMGLSSSKTKFIKNHWIKQLSKDRLEYMAMLYSTKHWRWIIDLLHLKPSDFQLEWFTEYIFTNKYPNNSIVNICSSLDNKNIKEVLLEYKLPYEYLKLKHQNLLNDDIKKIIATYISLADLIRHWNDFDINDIVNLTYYRLINGEELNMPYGELMKRIQNMRENIIKSSLVNKLIDKLIDLAEFKLCNYHITIEQPIVVFGDASGSMDIAIKTSSIITSILVKLCNAKMHLFRDKDEIIEDTPKNVNDVLTMMEKFKAHNATAPVFSLLPYYIRKEVIKTFILVTDEEENGKYENKDFADIFKLYREEVYPAKLVFVSFLKNNQDGQMVKKLKQIIPGIEKDIIQFIFNSKNPDLRKLDALLNMLSIESEYYDAKYMQISNYLIENNMNINEINKQEITDILKYNGKNDDISISITI